MQHADETAAAARCMLSDARKAHLVKARRHHEAGIPRNYRQRRRDIYEECADVDCVGSGLYDSHLFLGLQSRQSYSASRRVMVSSPSMRTVTDRLPACPSPSKWSSALSARTSSCTGPTAA